MDLFNKKKIQNLEAENKDLEVKNKTLHDYSNGLYQESKILRAENKELQKYNESFPIYCEKVNGIINKKIETMVAIGLVDTFGTTVDRVDNNEETIQALQQQVQQIQNEIITKETVQSLINKVSELLVKLNTK